MITGEGGDAIRVLISQLGKIPPEVRRKLVPRLRTAGKGVLADAKSRASWSSRIPGAIKLKVSTAKRNPGVFLRVDRSVAPHARPYEGVNGRTFRHPVFGNREVWVAQRARPFLMPAALAGHQSVNEAVAKAVDDAARAAGFR